MKIIDTAISDVKILEPVVYGDSRGYFMETWRDSDFKEQIAQRTFVQDNQSMSTIGVLRGLHYQLNNPQGKLVNKKKFTNLREICGGGSFSREQETVLGS